MTLYLAAAHATAAAPHSHIGWAVIGLILVFIGEFWPRKGRSR